MLSPSIFSPVPNVNPMLAGITTSAPAVKLIFPVPCGAILMSAFEPDVLIKLSAILIALDPFAVVLAVIVSGRPIVTVLSDTATVVSFDVALNVSVSVPIVTLSFDDPSVIANTVEIVAVDTAVIKPFPFTVITGIAVVLPNAPVLELTVSKVVFNVILPEPSNAVALASTSPAIVIFLQLLM